MSKSPIIESESTCFTTEPRLVEEPSKNVSKLREKYTEFINSIKKLHVNVDNFFNQLKKNLSFKMTRILTADELVTYFERILTKMVANPRQARKNWSEEETYLFVSLVAYYSLVRDEDYNNLVISLISSSVLIHFFLKSEETWPFLASIYPGKPEDKLRQKWQSVFKVTLSRIPWTSSEDHLLTRIVQDKTTQKSWKDIAMELYSRSGLGIYRHGRQCRERWVNHLDPTINRGYWTTEEDINLLKSYLELGRKWAEIAKKIGNRTENIVKNRWKSLMRKFKSVVSPQHLNAVPTNSLDEEERWEQLIAQAVLNCYEKAMQTKVPVRTQGTQEKEIRNSKSVPLTVVRNQVPVPQSREDSDALALKKTNYMQVESEKASKELPKPPAKINPRLMDIVNDQIVDNNNGSNANSAVQNPGGDTLENLNKFLENYPLIAKPELKKCYSQNNSTNVMGSTLANKFSGGFSSVNNSYMDSNSSYTFQPQGLNNSFDYAYLDPRRQQPNSGSLHQSVNLGTPTSRRSHDDFFLSKAAIRRENSSNEYGFYPRTMTPDDLQTPQRPLQTNSTANNTPIPMFRTSIQPEEANPDIFINYENENKSDSMNMDMLDFFSSEIDTGSEFSGFNRANPLNELLFNSKFRFRARAKSERDPTEHLTPEVGYGQTYGSEIVRANNRGVRKSSLDLLLESSTLIDGQEETEEEERQMNFRLKRFSEFKPDDYFNSQGGKSIFFALVDTSKNELYLVDSATKDNYRPTIQTIKLKKSAQSAHKPSIFEGLDLARYLPNDNLKSIKSQVSNFNLG
mgnify:FL=1